MEFLQSVESWHHLRNICNWFGINLYDFLASTIPTFIDTNHHNSFSLKRIFLGFHYNSWKYVTLDKQVVSITIDLVFY